MKIMMLTDFYPPHIGGIENYVQSLSLELVKRGHQVIVCTAAALDQPNYKEENGLKIYHIPALYQKIPFLYRTAERFHPPISDPVLSNNLKCIIEKEKPDVVHAHSGIVHSVIPVLRKNHIPLVLSLHMYAFICLTSKMLNGTDICDVGLCKYCVKCSLELSGTGFLNNIKYWFVYAAAKINQGKLRKSVSKFLAMSTYVKRVHQKMLTLDESRITVIPVFFTEMDDDSTTDKKLPDDFILFVGRLVPEKGIDTLIAAYRMLGTRTKLVLIGAGRFDDKYKDLENILLIENAPSGVVAEAYRKCRFAVFPSTWPEPFGTVNLEAMSRRKTVIATRIGGFPDVIVDGENGILVPPRDADALSRAMKYLLENPEIADIMGENGYQRWKKYFTADAIVPRIEKLYESVAREKRRV